jgi:2-amino-4-hydroxy-6-hydroxymethyldihydropteridine diphosphokinase
MSVIAFLGLGGNLGQPEQTIRQALAMLNEHPEIQVMAISGFYRTKPIDMAPSEGAEIPWFTNAVAEIRCNLPALQLLTLSMDIEQQLGRDRSASENKNAGAHSRTIDIDLLFYGDEIIHQSGLIVPHPRLHQRAFVLQPLSELAPDFRHPEFGQTIMELAKQTLAYSI